jgi:dihydrofolate reductase
MTINMIVAATPAGVIGQGNALPWHCPEDLAFFKRTTMGCPVVMGRKTYASIGRPLPGRENYVLTRNTTPIDGVTLLHEPHLPSHLNGKQVFIIGGSEVYKAFEDRIDEIYLTVVGLDVEGDAFLPFAIEAPVWNLQSAEHVCTKQGISLCFQHWTRNKHE